MLQSHLLPPQAEAWEVHPAQRSGRFSRPAHQLHEVILPLQSERTFVEHGRLAGVQELGLDGPGLVGATKEAHADLNGVVDQQVVSDMVGGLRGVLD